VLKATGRRRAAKETHSRGPLGAKEVLSCPTKDPLRKRREYLPPPARASGTAMVGIVAQRTRVGWMRGEGDNHRHEDFQPSNVVPEIGTHVHETTSNDIVTRLDAAQLCH
jgi:hypothetical protein